MKKEKQFTDTKMTDGRLYVRVNLLCGAFREKPTGIYVSHCPALGLYSQGESAAIAQQNIGEAVQLFIETCMATGQSEKVLSAIGFIRPQKTVKARAKKTAKPKNWKKTFKVSAYIPAYNQMGWL